MRTILEASGVEFSVVRIPMVLSKDMSAQVFKKIRFFLDWGLFPGLGDSTASLPCIRLEKLQRCISRLVSSPNRLEPLYQFAESVRWTSIVESYTLRTGRRVRSVPLPGLFLMRVFRFFHLEYFLYSLQVLMNVATFGDDSFDELDQLVTDEVVSSVRLIGSAEVKSIIW